MFRRLLFGFDLETWKCVCPHTCDMWCVCRSLGLPDKHFFLFESGSLYIALTVWKLLCRAGWLQTQRDRPASAYRLLEVKSSATMPGSVPQCRDVQCSTFTWWATWLDLWLGNLKQKCNGVLSWESLVQDPGFYMTISCDWSLHCERMHLCAPQCRLTKLLRLICLTKQGVNHPAGSYWPSGKQKSKCWGQELQPLLSLVKLNWINKCLFPDAGVRGW